ncbi:hypothetical protein PAPYR_11562 [Paratrimastix pyriformis]|uniref:Uncharacterized protein n=1 Tax=Paratrimastix pyriformis TaxID=342808 RepID=A0ABQ8UAK0_9EUKA|nr:hypothetical protein PAPYR_11562 [Paratrimastix pyriformis]
MDNEALEAACKVVKGMQDLIEQETRVPLQISSTNARSAASTAIRTTLTLVTPLKAAVAQSKDAVALPTKEAITLPKAITPDDASRGTQARKAPVSGSLEHNFVLQFLRFMLLFQTGRGLSWVHEKALRGTNKCAVLRSETYGNTQRVTSPFQPANDEKPEDNNYGDWKDLRSSWERRCPWLTRTRFRATWCIIATSRSCIGWHSGFLRGSSLKLESSIVKTDEVDHSNPAPWTMMMQF